MLLKILLDLELFVPTKSSRDFEFSQILFYFLKSACNNNYYLPVSRELQLSSSQLWLHIGFTWELLI